MSYISYYKYVTWTVEIGDEFEPEFDALPEDVRTEILALSRLLQQFGPQLGRPRVDTLRGGIRKNCGLTRRMACGEWLLRSIQSGRRSC
jgi:hypothetical protein